MQANQVMAFHQLVDHSIQALMDSVLLLTNNTNDVNNIM